MTDTTFALPNFAVQAEDIEVVRQAEESLCGAVLRNGAVFQQASEVVSAGDFRVDTCRWLWEAFTSLHEQQLKIDQFTAADELERMGKMNDFVHGVWSGRVYLTTLRDNGDPRNVLSYAENVADYSANRKMYNLFMRAGQWVTDKRRAKDIMADVMADLSKVSIYTVQDEWTSPLSAALSEAFDWSTSAAAGNIPGVPTGFDDLDRMLTALIAGNVYIIAGRPGTGKTALLISIIRFLAEKGFKVAVFSLEMSKMQVAQRLIAQEAGLNLKNVIDGKLSPEEWQAYAEAMGKLEKTGIFINDLSSIAINQIRGTSRKIKARHGLDLVIVDYIQLASADVKKNANREQEVSLISRGLKYLADELHVPVLAAAQLSREIERRNNKRPVLSDLRESGSLEQDAYCVMFIHRNEEEAEPKQNITEIIIAKHRNGEVGSIELVFRPTVAKFENGTSKSFN